MKSLTCPVLLLLTVFQLAITACGDGTDKGTAKSPSDTPVTAAAAPVSTIVTTPQYVMILRQKVADFAKWKAVYDSRDSARQANGLHNYVVSRGMNDSNTVMVALKIDEPGKAKTFANSAGFKQALQQGGIKGAPTVLFHEMVYQDTARLPESTVRVMSTFTVKDWDTWQKAFESNRQLRMNNGITDRVYGYDVSDKHKVALVFAFTDTAKANAYRKSDLFKQKRAEAGVISEPEMFFYRVVQRY